MVRELFIMAREHSPFIIFMDEIDSIGSTRMESGGGGDSEVQRTMLELLNQLDGFEAALGDLPTFNFEMNDYDVGILPRHGESLFCDQTFFRQPSPKKQCLPINICLLIIETIIAGTSIISFMLCIDQFYHYENNYVLM